MTCSSVKYFSLIVNHMIIQLKKFHQEKEALEILITGKYDEVCISSWRHGFMDVVAILHSLFII